MRLFNPFLLRRLIRSQENIVGELKKLNTILTLHTGVFTGVREEYPSDDEADLSYSTDRGTYESTHTRDGRRRYDPDEEGR